MTLAERLRREGGLIAAATADAEVPFTAEAAIREGERAHYAQPQVVQTEDPDLALLAGDYLYALGLAELARAEDLEAVALLAGVIARCARAHAEGRPADAAEAWESVR